MNSLETIKLSNGLNIYLYQDNKRHSTFFQLTTFCGGITKHFKYNNKEYHLHDGIAHILEHYIVECNDKGNFLDELGNKQMNTNASTSKEVTSFYFETVENIEYGINTMLEGIYNITFNKDKLEKLKKPIIQEIRGKVDNKFYHLAIKKLDLLFNNIDYRNTGGTIEEVKKTTLEELEVLYNAFYQPSNQFILIAGNFNNKTELIKYNEKDNVVKKEDIIYFPTPMSFMDISFKINTESFKKEEKLDLDFYINSFINSLFGITSPLYEELVSKEIIYDIIQCSLNYYDKYLIVGIGAYTTNPTIFKECVLNEIKTLNNLDENRFNLDRKSSIIRLILRDESIFKTINPLINNIVFFNYPFLDKVEDVKKLKYEDYKKVIKNLDFSNYITVEIKNNEE